ncbi:MAG: hypothetical protein IAG13_11085, partial [Deltaproteobacteria bacterium]|nr:hypothetical protein [Nannocystaceae bacterium]
MLVLAAWLALEPAEATAARGVTLEWIAPPACPGRDAVAERLDELLGGHAADSAPVDGRARVEVQRDGFTLLLRTTTASG